MNHGTTSTYDYYKCRCMECKLANAKRQRINRKNRRQNIREHIADLQAKLQACESENTKMLNALLIVRRYLKGTDSYYLAISTDRKLLGLGQVIEAAIPANTPDDPSIAFVDGRH
jgi:hypothetical protein